MDNGRMVGAISKRTHWHLASFRTFGVIKLTPDLSLRCPLSDAQLIFDRRHTCALHDVTGCKQWTMEEWWEQAHAHACHNTTCNCSCKLQYACKVSYLFEHRGEGTDQEFGKRCPHFTSPSYTGGLWRTRKTFGASK